MVWAWLKPFLCRFEVAVKKHTLLVHLFINNPCWNISHTPYWNIHLNISCWDIFRHSILEHIFKHSLMGYISTLRIGTYIQTFLDGTYFNTPYWNICNKHSLLDLLVTLLNGTCHFYGHRSFRHFLMGQKSTLFWKISV